MTATRPTARHRYACTGHSPSARRARRRPNAARPAIATRHPTIVTLACAISPTAAFVITYRDQPACALQTSARQSMTARRPTGATRPSAWPTIVSSVPLCRVRLVNAHAPATVLRSTVVIRQRARSMAIARAPPSLDVCLTHVRARWIARHSMCVLPAGARTPACAATRHCQTARSNGASARWTVHQPTIATRSSALTRRASTRDSRRPLARHALWTLTVPHSTSATRRDARPTTRACTRPFKAVRQHSVR